jgi:hypothetical protein
MKLFANSMTHLLEEGVSLHSDLIDKPITVFYDYPLRDISELNHNKYNFLFIQEPNQLFGYHDWAMQYGGYFDAILTWSQPILDKYPDSSLFFPFAFRTIELTYEKYHTDKNFEVSFLCGNKQLIEGHHLRHRIYSRQADILIPNHFIYTAPWEGGKDRCWKSMFHIAIENSQNKGYFTEKIIDAFLTKTIPIYWGCPNINDFFNSEGIVTFNNEAELIDIVNNLSPEYYSTRKDIIEENYKKAIHISDLIGRIKKTLHEICIINNI